MITTTINWQTTVLEQTVNISYTFSNGNPPTHMNVYSSWDGNGQSSSINRSYISDGTFTPVPTNEVYPYTAAFDLALSDIIEDTFINYTQPE